MMKEKIFYLYLFLSLLLLSCKDDLESVIVSEGEIELTHIDAVIATASGNGKTRAEGDPEPVPVVYLEDHISRFRFVDTDRMTLTTVKRTENALSRFSYNDITFLSNSNGAWDRVKNTSSDPERIYWSDATSKHTFIGYSLPNVSDFDWVLNGTIYYGSIGNPNENTQINYNPSSAESEEISVIENEVETPKSIPISSLMRAEDLLLTYDTEVVADASIAHIKFYHGLSSIKVKVMLGDFYGSELDGYTIVDNMVLSNQPTLYKWEQTSYKASARSNTHRDNNPRNMFLWDYVPTGVGENAGKTFTFYGITVPQELGYDMQDLVLSFRVRYPNPMKTDLAELKKNGTQPQHWDEKRYTATIPATPKPVYFHPNQCTVINIKLNHKDETMTIGAQYTDWEFVPTPDEGSLKKNSTFLQEAPAFVADENARKVTIANDSKATEDDATWLYYQRNPDGTFVGGDNNKVLLDIYGHTGDSKSSPYTISTANQLLSLAYEVSNGGHSFEGKYIKLDAGIIMQKDIDSETVSWLGIGDDGHPFQGTFLGGGRKISLLKGAPLFYNLGSAAVIDNLVLADQINISGTGALANSNAGKVIGCVVDADVESSQANAGSLLGSNTGTVEACYHIGSMTGTSATAGLVGQNSGTITGCYNAGPIIGSGTCYGVTNILSGGTSQNCYYNKTLAGSGLTDCVEMTTLEMQKEAFVSALNAGFNVSSKYAYTYNPAMYPTLIPYSETIPPLISTGYYRVKNIGSQKYVYVTDNKGSISSSEEDLGAIELKSEFGYSDPGSIIYIENVSGNEYNLHSQGTSVFAITGYNVIINIFDGRYRVGATSGFANRYLGDINGNASTHSSEAASPNYLLWDVIPVDETNYFGVTPTVNVGSSYYAPFYADFGFKVSSGMEVYYAELSDGSVTLKKIDSEIIPAKTPVIIKCKSNNAAENKLTLQHSVASAISRNALAGVLFNNETRNNRVQYSTSTMRVLSESDGNLVFTIPTDLTYLPANQSYLVVPAETTESELIVKFE